MTRLALSVALLLMPIAEPFPASQPERGYFSQYARIPSEATIAIRQEWRQLPADLSPWPVRLAVADCGRIGATGWAWMDGQPAERAIVFDCSGHDHTTAWMEAANIIAEVDYDTAVRWGIVGQGGISGAVIYD